MTAANLTPEGRMPVTAYTAAELHRMLVEDAVKSHATFLPWAVSAYQRIGERGHGAEAAFVAVLDEVEVLTGHRRMPVGSTTLTGTESAALRRPA